MNAQYEAYRKQVEDYLAKVLPVSNAVPDEGQVPQLLGQAMNYSLLAGGKRLRPVLLLAAYGLCSDDVTLALPFCAGLEMIHTYSLIHDDLPAMDDDDLRRGRPTCHKVYGEAMAILAGDGLLNAAYETMLAGGLALGNDRRALEAIQLIAKRAGVTGMVAGQTLDVSMEGTPPEEKLVRYIHCHKTADLFTAPMEAGLCLGGAAPEKLAAGTAYGFHLGLAFQMVDDLLDLVGDEKVLGKRTNVDAAHGKLTWPSVYGEEKTRQDAKMHVEKAIQALHIFGEKGKFLEALAQSTLERVQ